MKTKFLLTSVSMAAALLFTAAPAFAAKKPAAEPAAATPEKPAEKEKAKRDTYPITGEVVAITPKLLTLKGGKGKEDRKFDITADTKIVNKPKGTAGQPATLADIQVGKKIGGMAKKAEGSGNPTALDINVGVSQETTKKKADDTTKTDDTKTKKKK